MRKEDRLIRLLSLGPVDQASLDYITAILRDNPDWDHIIPAAGREGVTGLIYDRIIENRLEQFVPPPALTRLKSIYYTYSAQNALFYEELSRVAAALDEGGVPVILLKGAFLAAGVYENIALRPMRDLDLLVHKEDAARSVNILAKSGYQPLTAVKEQLANPFGYALTLAKGNVGLDNAVTVDLHWHILNASWLMGLSSGKCDMERIWSDAGTAVISGFRARVLSPEDLLISLAVNAFTHSYARLILLADFAQALEKYKTGIDWNLIHGRAKSCCLENILSFTLELVSRPLLPGARPGMVFKREHHYSRPVLMYILTPKGLIGKCRAFFRMLRVIIRIFSARLKPKIA
jgi:hypothetical protein